MNNESIYETVKSVLIEDAASRDNETRLIRIVLERLGYPSDLRGIENVTSVNVYGTISRDRRKIQRSNPFLKATKSVLRGRRKREEEIKEWNRKSL